MVLLNTVVRRRPFLIVGALAVAATLVPLQGTASAVPNPPNPTVASVTGQLDTLARQTEKLAERFNAAALRLGQARRAVATAQHRTASAAAGRDAAHARFVQLFQAQYEDGPSGSTGALLTSGSPQRYLDSLTMNDLLTSQAADVTTRYAEARTRAEAAQQSEQQVLAKAKAQRADLAAQRATVASRTTELHSLLATLTATQQQAYATRNAPSFSQISAAYKVHAGNAAAQKAVDFALAQVGKPYVWAAAGPDSFDCSGLTMAAWAAAGVQLPHLSSAQYNYGTHVGYDQLQPGDLVFLYSDLSHVEIYIGNGLAVSAPQPGENVKIILEANYRADFYGATRLA
ncbi:MAG: peptidoglycan DL-endopeptidase CwlO [Pseudonocardiales bacterium]|nr:peptidoglycan DL-endopeptidase CwlO [Pseudonocardiales bacterium]